MSKLQPNHVSLGSISESTRNSISAATGDLCFNTTSGVVEYYDGSSWKAISTTPFSATGGSKSTSGSQTIHRFTGGGNLVCSGSGAEASANYLVCAAGGSGGEGGGGAGQYRTGSFTLAGGSTYPIGIGGGGNFNQPSGNNGGDSNFGPINSNGGGRGGDRQS